MSIEQDLLKAADELEKVAMDMEMPCAMKDEKKAEKKEEKKESKKEDDSKEHESKESKEHEEKEDKESEEYTEKMASLTQELGIDAELAEKVASADPSVVEYIKNLNQESVESMGGDDTREKTAAEDTECPLGDFMSTPL